jgi:DNA-binding HxlR family transcriptional regulator
MPSFRCRGRVWDNPVQLALDTLGGKWRMPVLWRLKDRSLQFGELRRAVERNLVGRTLTDRALTLHLRALERHHLIDRTVTAGLPRRVTYSITGRGRAALGCITALQDYGLRLKAWEGGVDHAEA